MSKTGMSCRRLIQTQISHIESECHRLVSTRSMCDDACCDFLAKRIQTLISHVDQSPKYPNPDLSYIPSNDVSCPYEHLIIGDFGVWCRLGRCAMMHVVIFWPREYKNSYRTSTEHSSDQKLRDYRPSYLTKSIIIREYLNLGKISQFLLNHFDSEE